MAVYDEEKTEFSSIECVKESLAELPSEISATKLFQPRNIGKDIVNLHLFCSYSDSFKPLVQTQMRD